ncbi:hypothetical protein DL93DRAFT_2173821 [Clavulina sp. PMI_390]|nr:hypothetical protein DL93DRAFT_2173821 [Clavulina sp. PMI_390]
MSKPSVDRAQMCPFLVRTFVKFNGHHRMALFEDNNLPVADELQLYAWKDTSLRELVVTLRALPPNPLTTILRHPHARYVFRVIFPDFRGHISSKEIGAISSRDIQLTSLGDDDEKMSGDAEDKLRGERTLEELQLKPGDLLDVAVIVPLAKNDSSARSGTREGSQLPTNSGAWANANTTNGVGTTLAPRGSHWRGGAPAGRGFRRGSVDDEHDSPRGRGDSTYIARAGGRGGVQLLNRRGFPRRSSPDRTLGGSGDTRRGRSKSPSRTRSRSRTISRSRSPPHRGRSLSYSGSPIGD